MRREICLGLNGGRCGTDATPLGLKIIFGMLTQGSSCLATLGFGAQSLWDYSNWLLLREAVQRAEAPDQIHGGYADDGTVAEQPAQNAERHAVVRVVEGRDDDGGVADVKIRVARRQPHAVKIKRRRHRQLHDFGLAAIFEPQILDALPIFRKRTVIFVARIFFAHQHDRPGVHETADVINVAVRVVAFRAFGEPENVFDAEIIFERRLNLLFAEAGIADLDFRMQITFLGGNQRAASVQLNAATFDDEWAVEVFIF